MPSCRHLVEHRPERKDVGLRADRLATRLLGRHVADGPDDESRFGPHPRRAGGDGGVVQPREAEVEQLDVAIGPYHDVVGLDVAVNDLRPVRDGQRLGDLPRDAHRPLERKILAGEFTQRSAFDQFHRDVAIVSDDAGLVDRHDVWMVERRGKRRFSQKSLEGVVLRVLIGDEYAPDDFQCDVASETRVLGAIDLSHAADTELADDLVRADTCPLGKGHGKTAIISMEAEQADERIVI